MNLQIAVTLFFFEKLGIPPYSIDEIISRISKEDISGIAEKKNDEIIITVQCFSKLEGKKIFKKIINHNGAARIKTRRFSEHSMIRVKELTHDTHRVILGGESSWVL